MNIWCCHGISPSQPNWRLSLHIIGVFRKKLKNFIIEIIDLKIPKKNKTKSKSSPNSMQSSVSGFKSIAVTKQKYVFIYTNSNEPRTFNTNNGYIHNLDAVWKFTIYNFM